MSSWFVIINILLLFSSSFLQARYRANSKRRYSMSTQSFVPSFPFNDNNIYADNDDTNGINNEDSWIDSKETTSTTSSDHKIKQMKNKLNNLHVFYLIV